VSLHKQSYVDHVLPENVIQFQLPAVDTARIRPGQTKALFLVLHLCRAVVLSYKEDSFLRTIRKQVQPERRVRTNVKILRVNSTYALKVKLSRRSEVSPGVTCFCRVSTSISMVLDWVCFPGFAGCFVLINGACLGRNMNLESDIQALSRLILCQFTPYSGGMTGPEARWGRDG